MSFKAQCSVKLGGGSVNSAIEFALNLALQSRLNFTDPPQEEMSSIESLSETEIKQAKK